MEAEGAVLPIGRPITKAEERELKRLRRKVKNKLSAQDSRRRRKEFMSHLQVENEQLRTKVSSSPLHPVVPNPISPLSLPKKIWLFYLQCFVRVSHHSRSTSCRARRALLPAMPLPCKTRFAGVWAFLPLIHPSLPSELLPPPPPRAQQAQRPIPAPARAWGHVRA